MLLLEPHQAAANLALLAAAQLGKLAVDRLLLMRSLVLQSRFVMWRLM